MPQVTLNLATEHVQRLVDGLPSGEIPILGIGAGQHAKVMIDTLQQIGGFTVIGLLDRVIEKQTPPRLGIPLLGDDGLLGDLLRAGIERVFLGVGKSTLVRKKLYQQATRQGARFVTCVHPAAVISPTARLDSGCTVLAGAVVNTEAVVGCNALINTRAVVEHDCLVEPHAHIASGATLTGGVVVEEGAFVGAGSTLLPGVRIGKNAVVGAGAVVVRDVPAGVTVMGIPAAIGPRNRTTQSDQGSRTREGGTE